MSSEPILAQDEEKQSFVYGLKLERNKYYIGYTERNDYSRIEEHFANGGSKWTMKFKPQDLLFFQPGTLEDENRITIEFMRKHGWWNVRGGEWCEVALWMPPAELELPRTYRDECQDCLWCCSNCMNSLDCQDYNQRTVCKRCGRNSHKENSCYAHRHINGRLLGRLV